MKVLALSRKERTVIPDDFKSEKNPPKFTVKSISKRQHLLILAEHSGKVEVPASMLTPEGQDGSAEPKAGTVTIGPELWKGVVADLDGKIAVLKKGLVGWVDVLDSAGDVFEFEEENFEFLDESILDFLVHEISGTLTEEEEKNSDTESPSSSGSGTKKTQTSGTATTAEKRRPSKKEIATASTD